jgi:hypothetical protein
MRRDCLIAILKHEKSQIPETGIWPSKKVLPQLSGFDNFA